MTAETHFPSFGHPSEEQLFRFLEAEAPKPEATAIEDHVKACWECQAQLKAMREAMNAYVAYRHEVLERAAPAAPDWLRFSRRLRETASTTARPSTRRLLPRSVVTLAAVAGLIAWLIFIGRAPVVSAREALANATAAEATTLARAAQPVIHQRIRITRGASHSDGELWRAPTGHQFHERWTDDAVIQPLAAAYRSQHLDFQQPLSASTFATWRNSAHEGRDDVAVDLRRDLVRISTTSRAADAEHPIVAAVVALRRSDWHPVEETLRVRNAEGTVADYTLQEISFEVIPLEQVAAGIFDAPVNTAPTLEVPAGELPALTRSSRPTDAELSDAEAQLRETLHDIHADVREAPEIWRDKSWVYFHVRSDDEERHAAISGAVASLPHVVESDRAPVLPAPQANRETSTSQPAVLHIVEPPLAKALEESLGGLDQANAFLDHVRDAYLSSLAGASALRRLGERYSPDLLGRQPVGARARITGIAADHVRTLQDDAATYVNMLSPILDAMLERSGIGVTATPAPTDARVACAPWQDTAPLVVEDLRELQRAFNPLFVKDETDRAVSPLAEDLLTAAARARRRLQDHLHALCRPL